MRKLASIQKIVKISPIEGADKIEVAGVLGWECVVAKKDNFKVGDFVVYIEIDSIVPEKPEFEFLKPRKFRVKTIKLRKQVSQGLIIPISMLPDTPIVEDLDVTDILGIIKHDPQLVEENDLVEIKSNSKIKKMLMRVPMFRKIYLHFNSNEKGNFPSWIKKTDEENIQKCAKVISENFDDSFYITEKLEGQSLTAFNFNSKVWGFNKKKFGIASRNMWLKTKNNSKYWQSAEKYELERILMDYKNITIQAEQIGVGIQGNIYKLEDIQIRVFNVIVDNKKMGYDDMHHFCVSNHLIAVPIINGSFIPSQHISSNDTSTIVKWFLDYSNGVSDLYKTKREGIVVRLNSNPDISFKVRSPEYLLEHGQ